MSKVARQEKPQAPLRRGWTTGACATAAAKSALSALLTGDFQDPVSIKLPRGETPAFVLSTQNLTNETASAGIIKDAGDDPDVTHGATIISTVRFTEPGSGIQFCAGEGVGTVTKPGLPIPPGEAAINPVPRQLMCEVVKSLCAEHDRPADVEIVISVPGGTKIAERTWNPRLGILGGISILGTTGIVHPFSCSAWIHSIMRGIDVCRANNIHHALAATGSTSEEAAAKLYDFADEALLDMGDFAGGLLKYLSKNPIANLTLAGGFGKFTKLAAGSLDLHSARSQVDLDWLAEEARQLGLDKQQASGIAGANTALEALDIAGKQIDLADHIANLARKTAVNALKGAPVNLEVLVFSRQGQLLARSGDLDV